METNNYAYKFKTHQERKLNSTPYLRNSIQIV